MEDILASIKRIIAEDAENGGHVRARRRVPPPTIEHDEEVEEVLELSDPAPQPVHFQPEPVAPAPMPMSPRITEVQTTEPMPAPIPSQPIAATPALVAETIVSDAAAEASRAPLDTLSKMVEKPEAPAAIDGSITLDALARDMLRPMLREWLDTNLPSMVEALVAKEIARIAGGR